MKTLFYKYGWRETKNWACPCGTFWAGGMDLAVDESIARHQETCEVFLKPKDPVLKKLQELKERIIAVEKTIGENNTIKELQLKLQTAQYTIESERSMSNNNFKVLHDTEVKLEKAKLALAAIGNRVQKPATAQSSAAFIRLSEAEIQQTVLNSISKIVFQTLEEIK